MAKKQSRTKLDSLPAAARVLDNDDLCAVSGGLRRGGGFGGVGGAAEEGTWTWTAPTTEGDIYRKDDE